MISDKFRINSIRGKLVSIILFVSALALSIAFIINTVITVTTFKTDLLNNMTVIARLTGEECISPLAFEDRTGAEDILQTNKIMTQIAHIDLFDAADNLFASYSESGGHIHSHEQVSNLPTGYLGSDLFINQQLVYDGQFYGTIHFHISTAELNARIRNHIISSIAVVMIILLLTLILAGQLQKIISMPILNLAKTTKEISSSGDYSVRAEKQAADEVGILYDSFNAMLDQIQSRSEESEIAEAATKTLAIQQKSINELSLELGKTLDHETIYNTIYTRISEIMTCDTLIISMYNSEEKQIIAAYVNDGGKALDVSEFPPIPIAEKSVGKQSKVIATGESLYIPDWLGTLQNHDTHYSIEDDGRVQNKRPSVDQEDDFTHSGIFSPMKIAGEVIGILQVQSKKIDDYLLDQIELLDGLANVAAIAIQNSKLYGKLEKHREQLQELVDERTERLQKMVNLMTGREVRLADLKAIVKKLHDQLESAGLKPVAADPLATSADENP